MSATYCGASDFRAGFSAEMVSRTGSRRSRAFATDALLLDPTQAVLINPTIDEVNAAITVQAGLATADGFPRTVKIVGQIDGSDPVEYASNVRVIGDPASPTINLTDQPWGARPGYPVNDAFERIFEELEGAVNATIVIPNGQYTVYGETITVPRGVQWTFLGAGRGATSFYGDQLGASTPLFTYEENTESATNHVWEGMVIARGDAGPVFKIESSGDPRRLVGAVFRDMHFQCLGLTGELVKIQGMLHCRLVSCSFQGGQYGMILSGSHFVVSMLSSTLDHAQVNGLQLTGAGNAVLEAVRIEACEGGDGVYIDGGNISMNGCWFEGKRTQNQIHISANSYLISLDHVALSSPVPDLIGNPPLNPSEPFVGLRIEPAASIISAEHMLVPVDFSATDSYAVKVGNNCRNVHISGHGPVGFTRDGTGSGVNYWVDETGVADVSLEIWTGVGHNQRTVYTAGIIGAYTNPENLIDYAFGPPRTGKVSAAETDHFRLTFGTATEITGMAHGHEGQVVTLTAEDAFTTVLSSGNTRLAGGVPFAMTAGMTLTLLCVEGEVAGSVTDGVWREIGRAA